eukprot:TRINITY_DN80589_c0_g1_i1.p1 TRINITY_DN80589_c0_g1~~TRINITY_DN80589_c0_g1_i1.p1  ORF type:complete len:330 (-),score=52.65 TRINITY_DN80589_c0_g1_i1:37-1026(-)
MMLRRACRHLVFPRLRCSSVMAIPRTVQVVGSCASPGMPLNQITDSLWQPRLTGKRCHSNSSKTTPIQDLDSNDPLCVLGLRDGFTEKELKQAYLKAAMQYHPDVNKGDEARAKVCFQKVSRAYEILSDPNWERKYSSGASGGAWGEDGPNWKEAKEMWEDKDMWDDLKGHPRRAARDIWVEFMCDVNNLQDALAFYLASLRLEVHMAYRIVRDGGVGKIWPLLRAYPMVGPVTLLAAGAVAITLRFPFLLAPASRLSGHALRTLVCFVLPHVLHIFLKPKGGQTIWEWVWKQLIMAAKRARARQVKLSHQEDLAASTPHLSRYKSGVI